MREPIGIGDLVMFVRPCCDKFMDGVTIFEVLHMKPRRPAYACSYCRRPLPQDRYASDHPEYGGAPLQWLKKIPPLNEPEDVKREEGIHA